MPKRQADPKLEHLWRRRVAQWRRSGLTIRDFCDQRGLSEANFYAWRRELRRRDARRAATVATPVAPPFVPVQVVPPPTASPLELVLTSGRIVRVTPGFDADTLRRLLATVDTRAEGASC